MANAVHRGVVDDLGRRITAGTVAPGAVFTVARLEADYQVSRTVVREAVRVLESLRLVESRRRVGLRVRPRDEWCALDPQVITWSLEGPFRQRQLAALMELRVAIEPVAAELAATRASTAQRAELNRLAEQLRFLGEQSKGNDPEFLAADLAFHDTLLLASGNPMFIALRGPIGELLCARASFGLHPAVPEEGTLEEHVATAEAIGQGAAAEARAHSARHMGIVRREVEHA
ncbi:FadR/GntR family transcriptional regulator [Naumannella halotolerans]|uniref:DNA-binding FadR family transcriptional regulator n=1 Tax=Naumannella halotolerans TaxID=993414 RepID=A0A4R7J7H8_9ACTN|nr:FCD domain-containing protein [Naumannella halotolerans]TDT33402.1 DNA-binding FadR family transcriptional regulator [Naumannella halotolerans]